MEQRERDRLAEVMAAAEAGDARGATSLYLEFGGRVRAVVCRQLRRFNVAFVGSDGLVFDACIATLLAA